MKYQYESCLLLNFELYVFNFKYIFNVNEHIW